jgi:hypothetical protein
VWLPQALTIGIDYNLFWQLNPKKLEPFVESFKQRQEIKHNENNLAAWLQGIYNSRAIAAVFSKDEKYFEKPIDLNGKDESAKAAATRFEILAMEFNKKFNKEKGV